MYQYQPLRGVPACINNHRIIMETAESSIDITTLNGNPNDKLDTIQTKKKSHSDDSLSDFSEPSVNIVLIDSAMERALQSDTDAEEVEDCDNEKEGKETEAMDAVPMQKSNNPRTLEKFLNTIGNFKE